jgi:hypothetical protein
MSDEYSVPITYFVEVDNRVKDHWLIFLRDHGFLKDMLSGEIGIHIHDWRWNTKERRWIQEVNDDKFLFNNTIYSYELMRKYGISPSVHSRGWNFVTLSIIKSLVHVKIYTDFSCMPGKVMSFQQIYFYLKYGRGMYDWRNFKYQMPFYCKIDGSQKILLIPNSSDKSFTYYLSADYPNYKLGVQVIKYHITLSKIHGISVLVMNFHNYSLDKNKIEYIKRIVNALYNLSDRNEIEVHFNKASDAVASYLTEKGACTHVVDAYKALGGGRKGLRILRTLVTKCLKFNGNYV